MSDTMTDSEEVDVVEAELVTLEDVQRLFNESKVERLSQQMENGYVNPIVLAKVLDIRPQMIYNYISKGKIKGVIENSTQKKVIELDEAMAFARKYLDNKARKQAKIEAELAGEAA